MVFISTLKCATIQLSTGKGRVAERLCRGLQILVDRFDSGLDLHNRINMSTILEFEQSVLSLETQLETLKKSIPNSDGTVPDEITKLQVKIDKLLKRIYSKLSPWDIVQVARLPERPKFTAYLNEMFTDFVELCGDRVCGEDAAIVGGFAKINNRKCIVIGQEKGTDTETRLKHNFGMARPEGYRKVVRLLDLADRFNLPVIAIVDTSGAYPGIESEERGQAEAIARCIEKSLNVHVPIISTIIGEGGSGGAIAIATADFVLMLEHSIYSVISPEGCASILWKDEKKASAVAEILHLTANDLKKLGIIDIVIKEPAGGAHRNKLQTIQSVKKAILTSLDKTKNLKDIRSLRRKKFETIGL